MFNPWIVADFKIEEEKERVKLLPKARKAVYKWERERLITSTDKESNESWWDVKSRNQIIKLPSVTISRPTEKSFDLTNI